MASSGVVPKSEIDGLVRNVRGQGLLNRQLQNICTLNGLRANGVKADLQKRIADHIYMCSGDPKQFQQVRQSVQDTRKAGRNAVNPVPYGVHQASPAAPASGHSSRASVISSPLTNQYQTPPRPLSSLNPQQKVLGAHAIGLQFKESPFYQIEQYVGEIRVLEEMQHHRNTVDLLVKSQDQQLLSQCGPGSNLRVMLLCAASNQGVQNIAFPQNSELRVNSNDVKANMRGLKNKPGSTRPVDLTDYLRLKPQYTNRVAFTYALTTQARGKSQSLSKQKYHLILCICRVTSVEELAKDLEASKTIPKEFTISDLRRKAADPDVIATSQKLSLKCPLSYMRLGLPCRGQSCKHIQCFDATSYLQLQEQGPQWKCPICNNEVKYGNLAVDMYVKEILGRTADDLEQVMIEPDGQWHTGKETPGGKYQQPIAGTPVISGGDDDDVIAIPDDKGFSTPFTPARSLRTASFVASRESSGVPKPVGGVGGGTKRSADVIDLTLDSDDDEPVRPIKKAFYGHPQAAYPVHNGEPYY